MWSVVKLSGGPFKDPADVSPVYDVNVIIVFTVTMRAALLRLWRFLRLKA